MTKNYNIVLDDVCDPLTVVKFSEKFSISRDESIKVMQEYLKSKCDTPLWALYEVYGVLNASENPFLPDSSELSDEKVFKILIVPEKELEFTEKQFKEVLSKSLHSLQRTNPKETRVYGRQWDNNDDLAGVTVPQQKVIIPAKEKSSTPEPSTKPSKSTIQPIKKQANVMSMFSKAKPKEVKEVVNEVKKEKSPSPVKEIKKVKVESIERTPSPVIEKKNRKRPKIEVDEDDSFDRIRSPSPVSERSGVDEPVEVEVPKQKRKKHVVNDENKKKATSKKIIAESDEKPEEMKPQKEKTKVTSNDRRRTTKIEKIVETFIDEDGFLVSKEINKTVEVSPEKKKSPDKEKAKITAPAPGQAKVAKKNATITSFFKKA